jgi:hypothetical protein
MEPGVGSSAVGWFGGLRKMMKKLKQRGLSAAKILMGRRDSWTKQ